MPGTSVNTNFASPNSSIKDLKIENGRLYIPDPNNEIKIKGNWVRKEASKRVYLVAPNKFYYSELSLPTSPTNLSELYNQVYNAMMVSKRCQKYFRCRLWLWPSIKEA